jgi:hypothetical protein
LSQRGHEMNGRELGILNGIFFVRGSHDWEYGLGLWAQTPWDSLEHLANLANVMSYTLHGFFEVPYYKPISFTISLSLIVQTNAKPKLIKQTNDQWKF